MDGTMKAIPRFTAEAEHLSTQSLPGLQGIHVWVSQLDVDLEAEGLDRKRLGLEAQRRLTQAGLPLTSQPNWQATPLFPCLGILVHADRVNVLPPSYIYSVEVFFVQKITLADSPTTNAMRMTWCREAIGDVRQDNRGFDWTNLYSTVGLLADQFIQEILGKASPGKSARASN